MKLISGAIAGALGLAFSILERIELGETQCRYAVHCERAGTFSILERIELGETIRDHIRRVLHTRLSVSSNGSNWVKQRFVAFAGGAKQAFSILERIELGETRGCGNGSRMALGFQYPRTDRIG